MAHYIAELIQDAEKASAEERPAKMRACCDAIFNLWKHRHTLPNGKRPFLVSDEDSMLKASDPGEKERIRIEDRIERLEAFTKMAMAVVSELRQEVQQAEGTGGDLRLADANRREIAG
jgi:hypothetical protein